MCASYGLDPRFTDPDDLLGGDENLTDTLRAWATGNAGETLRPTGKNLRNLNPVIGQPAASREMILAWWGYLEHGEPARYPSINTRAERLQQQNTRLSGRVLIPATSWFEMRKPDRTWFSFDAAPLALVAMAGVSRPGRTADGVDVTCYSMVMRPATRTLEPIHDRVPLLIPGAFADEWLTSDAPTSSLVNAALAASDSVVDHVVANPLTTRPY